MESGQYEGSRLFAYENINTKKDGGNWECHPGQGEEGTRVTRRAPMAWESHLRDGSERMGRVGGVGGDA